MPEKADIPEKKNDLEKMGLPKPLGSKFASTEKSHIEDTEAISPMPAEHLQARIPEIQAEVKPEQKTQTPEATVQKMVEVPMVSVVIPAAPVVTSDKDELT